MSGYGYEMEIYALVMQMFATYSVIISGVGIISIVAMWKIFEKAGEAGWKALIPFYREYIMYEITLDNGILFLLYLVPCVNIVFHIKMCLALAKRFGKETGYGIGLILLNPIFSLMLAFGDAKYDKNK